MSFFHTLENVFAVYIVAVILRYLGGIDTRHKIMEGLLTLCHGCIQKTVVLTDNFHFLFLRSAVPIKSVYICACILTRPRFRLWSQIPIVNSATTYGHTTSCGLQSVCASAKSNLATSLTRCRSQCALEQRLRGWR